MDFQLHADKLIHTADQLALRVAERLPGSGLSKVVADMAQVARDAVDVSERLRPPYIVLRVLVGLLTLGVLSGAVIASASLRMPAGEASAIDIAQGLEATLNIIVFGGAGIFFAWSIETRLKRRLALGIIAQLRSVAHVVDMHQLAKDPDRLYPTLPPTENSPPKLQLTPELLVRYLDYCSEALSILSKLAAMLVQRFDDPVTLDAVNDLEVLTNGLSRKIMQKIMIVHRK